MGKKDRNVTLYINKSAPFAQPILNHLRGVVHEACPEVEETIKWGFPNYLYKGILCNMAAFNEHCSFGFWKAALMSDPHKLFPKKGNTGMGDFGRITSMTDLPPDKTVIAYIKEAMKLNEEGTSVPKKERGDGAKTLNVPSYFVKALERNKKARETFEGFSYSMKREYVDWVTDAKTDATRDKRLATSLEWLAKGKTRNWKYEKK